MSCKSKSYTSICLDDSTWDAPKNVFLKKLNFNITNSHDADIVWSDCQWDECQGGSSPDPLIFNKLSKDQKINYLPNANNTFRKDVLTDNINRFRRDFPEVFEDIMPRSWDLPKEYEEFSLFCEQTSSSQPYFIVKENNEQRGDGIYLTNNPKSDIKNTDDVVVSLYIDKPLLMDSCKFDFRVFVLIASLDPLTIYVHEEGLMRLASERYQHPNPQNKKNLYMHLTNGSLNTKNKNSIHKAISANSLKAFENENMSQWTQTV